MPLAADVMMGGVSATSARGMQGQTNGAVAAAGTGQSDATALTMSNNAVTSGTGGVRLPSAEIADEVAIVNLTSANITIYPPTGERVNQLANNTGFVLGANSAVKVKKFTSTRWMGFLSA